jgi:hypothetical protein
LPQKYGGWKMAQYDVNLELNWIADA